MVVIAHDRPRMQFAKRWGPCRCQVSLSLLGLAFVGINLITMCFLVSKSATISSRGMTGHTQSPPILSGSHPSKDWFEPVTSRATDVADDLSIAPRVPTHTACQSDNIDGILHISMGDIGGAAGTVFFQLILGQAIYASRNRLKPWVHMDNVSYLVYDEDVHGRGLGVTISTMVGRNATVIRRPIRVLKDMQPGPLDNRPVKQQRLQFPGTGVWEHYFEPISDFIPGDRSCENKLYATLSLRLITPGIHKFVHWAPRCWRYNKMPDYMSKPHLSLTEWLEPHRKMGHDAVQKFLKPRRYILDGARAANPGCSISNSCLGIHIRHSDKAEGRRKVATAEFLDYAESFVHAGGKYIYVATDSVLVLDEIEKSWPGHIRERIRTMGDGVVRSTGDEAVFNIGKHHRTNKEILIEIYALAECQFLVHGLSAVTESAIWINNNLHLRSVNLEDPESLTAVGFGILVQMALRGDPARHLPAPWRTDDWWNDEYETELGTVTATSTCEGFDGILHIASVGSHQATGGAFFNSILNQLDYAERHRLKPWIHLSSDAEYLYDEKEHGVSDLIFPEHSQLVEVIIPPTVTKFGSAPVSGPTRVTKISGSGIWSSYFEPLAPNLDHASCRNKTIFRMDDEGVEKLVYQSPEAIRAWRYDEVPDSLWDTSSSNLTGILTPIRERASRLLTNYYRFHPRLLRQAETINRANESCLALHLRNTDKEGVNRQKVGAPIFLDYLNAFVDAGGEHIFLASDSHKTLRYIDQNFPERLRKRMRSAGSRVVRSFREFAPHLIENHHRVNSEALVDALAMSHCSFLLHGHSTLSEAAIYLNPALQRKSVNLEDPDRINVADFRRLVSSELGRHPRKPSSAPPFVAGDALPRQIETKRLLDVTLVKERTPRRCKSNAIVYLAQKMHSSYGRESYSGLVKSLKLLSQNYLSVGNHSANTDVFLFHTGDFLPDDLRLLPNLHLVDLSNSSFWARPRANMHDIPEKDWYAYPLFSEGYRRMIHWYAIDIWRFFKAYNEETNCSYRYIWRMDEDSYLHSPIEYDVFDFMRDGGYVYGFRLCAYELQVTRRMWTAWRRKQAKWEPQRSVELELCGFYNNFFVADLEFFQSKQVQSFLRFIDARGHIFRRRLGDLMIHSMAVYGYAESRQIHRFLDFTYEHGTIPLNSSCVEWGGIQAGYRDPNAWRTVQDYFQETRHCSANATMMSAADLSPSYSHLDSTTRKKLTLMTVTVGRVEVPGKGIMSG